MSTDLLWIVALAVLVAAAELARPRRRAGGGRDRPRPLAQGVPKYFRTRLPDAILAVTGERFAKKFSSHDLRRTVATRLAESIGDAGDKLVKRVLGYSDASVTAIYNRCGYVKEMRKPLEQWANDLTNTSAPQHPPGTLARLALHQHERVEVGDLPLIEGGHVIRE